MCAAAFAVDDAHATLALRTAPGQKFMQGMLRGFGLVAVQVERAGGGDVAAPQLRERARRDAVAGEFQKFVGVQWRHIVDLEGVNQLRRLADLRRGFLATVV